MDQTAIGEFIAAKRKGKGLTQKELADKLNISEKTISKWETGHGLPEVSNMQPLCKELDITVTELLNGKENTKIKEDKVVDYIKYKEKKSKNKMLITILLSTLIILVVILGTYFFNTFNRIIIYELSGESEHFSYGPVLVMKSNMKNLLVEGDIDIKDGFIDENKIITISYYCEDQLIESHRQNSVSGVTSTYYYENNGYDEVFDEYKLKNIDKWKVIIEYETKEGNKQETIPLQIREVMKNNKLFYKKSEKLSSGNNSDYENITKEMDEELDQLKEELLKKGFTNTQNQEYVKKTENGEFNVQAILSKDLSTYEYFDKDYYVRFKPGFQTYWLTPRKNYLLGIHYTIPNDNYYCYEYKSEGQKVDCPSNIKELINNYKSIIEKEFKDIIPEKKYVLYSESNDE